MDTNQKSVSILELAAKETADVPTVKVAATKTTMSRDELSAKLLAVNTRLADLRSRVFVATRKRTDARSELALALAAYQAGKPRLSFQDNIRSYLSSSVAERAKIASGQADMPLPVQIADSAIDRSAAYGVGGTANDHLRQNFLKHGGYRKGSYPASAKGSRVPQ